LILMVMLTAYLVTRSYPHIKQYVKRRKRKYYEERILLETRIIESIYDSLLRLERVLHTEDIQKLILMFSIIVRKYFKSLFNLKYEFTYEELMKELEAKKVNPTFKEVLTKFFNRSIEIEFSGKSVSVQELEAMIAEFKQILSYTSATPLIEQEVKKERKEHLSHTDMMFSKISEAESMLIKEDLNNAFYLYKKLVHEFKQIPEQDKTRVQEFLSRLYQEMRLARERYDYEHPRMAK